MRTQHFLLKVLSFPKLANPRHERPLGKHPTSTADIIGTAKALLEGATANTDIFQKYSLDPKALGELLDKFIQQEARQEKLKADLHQTSSDQVVVRKSLLSEFGRWVSVLEGQRDLKCKWPAALWSIRS